jgi:hypothetical protein
MRFLRIILSDELLSISRRCVSADQADSSNRNIEGKLGGVEAIKSGRGAGVSDDALTTARALCARGADNPFSFGGQISAV